ncbi:MAG TPA: EAL domain-containing protein [Hyphomicrobiaceae bacterium]
MSDSDPCCSAAPSRGVGEYLKGLMLLVFGLLLLTTAAEPARALEPIEVRPDQDRIEITGQGEIHTGQGDTLQVDTASGPDGVSGRMSIRASTPGTNPNWLVFALRNPTDKPIERWLTAERYTVIGSSVIWPDLDTRRIEAVTPSLGYLPDRVRSDRADIFRITLEPGQTITYAAELASERIPRVFLWKSLEYELNARDRQLFNGIMLGITGLLAIFLTAVFAANQKAIFPAAALVAWCVLGYLCVDFGFWHKLFHLKAEDNAVYRAATESAIAASIVIFVSVFLRLSSWHGFIRMVASVWIAAQLALVFVAVIDPRLAATFARASFAVIGSLGALLTLYLAIRGQDRALALIPTWLLFLVWIFAAAVTLTGQLSGDIVVSALAAGLVLIVVLMGFTVTQFAFRSFEPVYGAAPSEMQLRSMAIDGSGAAVWEWLARRDEIKVSPVIEASLGLTAGELSTKVDDFAKHLHPADRERFRLVLWGVQERNGGPIHIELRMRHTDNSYRWFEIEAASVPHSDRRALRCVGLMRDITEAKRAQERLMHDAVHCSLTGLPNKALFLDRLGVAIMRAKVEQQLRPTVFFIDIDRFKNVNASLGLIVGDSILLTVARRLMRHVGPQDTLARVGGDQFAMLLVSHHEPRELALLAERVRRSLRSPIKIAGQEISLTTSTGIAVMDGDLDAEELLKQAEIAMYRAKRSGADRIEMFMPDKRREPDDRVVLEGDLRRALERNQIHIEYQPIIYLPTEELAGFEALVRWDHPKLGRLSPAEFVPIAEKSDLIVKLGSYVLTRAAEEAAKWQKELPRGDNPVFVSVNVSSRQLFRQDLIQEIRHILGRALVPPRALRLEITESVAMENPEQAVHVLELLRSAGAGLSIDDFGTGYSSLAYLQRFPFDTIKIDQGLVQAINGNGPGAAIVRSIVALAHELGKKVVGEGIEVAEDANFLRGLGCEYGQGYYYGEAMSDREALQLVRTIRKSERKLQRSGLFRPRSLSRRRKKRTEVSAPAPATAEAPALTPAEASQKANVTAPDSTLDRPAEPTKSRKEKGKPEAGRRGLQAAKQLLARTSGKRAGGAKSDGADPAAGPSAGDSTSKQKTGSPVAVPPLPLQPKGSHAAPPPAGAPAGAQGESSARTQPPSRGVPRTQPPPVRQQTQPPPPPQDGAQQPVRSAPPPPRPSQAKQPPGPPPVPPKLTPGPKTAPPHPRQPAVAASPQQPRPGPTTAPPPPSMRKGGPPARPTAPPVARQPGPPPPAAPSSVTAPPRQPAHTAPPPPNGAAAGRTPPPAPPPGARQNAPQFPSLPPAIAESLAKLAGMPIADASNARPADKSGNGAASGPAEPVRPRVEAKGSSH